MRVDYGEKLREFLLDKTTILRIIYFGDFHVFEQGVDTCIVLLKKQPLRPEPYINFANVPSTLKSLKKQ
ncbi:MAG: hypothetical protein N2712_06985 [Brevinematales bacterium]|nr:hypothetical protein [Brevinematales bacterium]